MKEKKKKKRRSDKQPIEPENLMNCWNYILFLFSGLARGGGHAAIYTVGMCGLCLQIFSIIPSKYESLKGPVGGKSNSNKMGFFFFFYFLKIQIKKVFCPIFVCVILSSTKQYQRVKIGSE